jgi:hypothetical protein
MSGGWEIQLEQHLIGEDSGLRPVEATALESWVSVQFNPLVALTSVYSPSLLAPASVQLIPQVTHVAGVDAESHQETLPAAASVQLTSTAAPSYIPRDGGAVKADCVHEPCPPSTPRGKDVPAGHQATTPTHGPSPSPHSSPESQTSHSHAPHSTGIQHYDSHDPAGEWWSQPLEGSRDGTPIISPLCDWYQGVSNKSNLLQREWLGLEQNASSPSRSSRYWVTLGRSSRYWVTLGRSSRC